MESKKLEQLWGNGVEVYDSFLEKVFNKPRTDIQISNPRTKTLELFALLNKEEDKYPLIGAMCAEVAENFYDKDLFAVDGKLYERVVTSRRFNPKEE